MPRYVTPEHPFILTGALAGTAFTRPPQRAVPMNRMASAVVILLVTLLTAVLAELAVSIIASFIWRDVKGWALFTHWWSPWQALLALLPIAFYAWRWNRIKVRWHFTGYHMTDEEVYVRSGLMHRELSIVPFARIQNVEVFSGPVQRRFDLASITIRCAGSSETIDDLDPRTAAQLRDRLTELARVRRLPV